MPNYWLMKTEPETFSWDDLLASPHRTTSWDGVRNYQARNLMRDGMRRGDRVLFYHSQTSPPAVVGLARVVREAFPDPTQFDRKSKYFDAGSDPADPRWVAVDIQADRPLKRPIGLPELKTAPGLEKMVVTQRGSRLSVQPVLPQEWKVVLGLEKKRP
jgi:predicted RNA-binding protein with PUA-like domain